MKQLWAKEEIIDATKDNVKANPTLAGTETEMTGIEINGTKYAMASGGKLYKHECYAYNVYFKVTIIKTIYTSSSTPIAANTFSNYIYPSNSRCALGGTIVVDSVNYPIIYCNDSFIYYLKDGTLSTINRISGSAIDAFYDTVTEV